MSGPELAEALWCVVSLRIKPDEQWMDDFMAGKGRLMHGRMPPCPSVGGDGWVSWLVKGMRIRCLCCR